jgi:predicted phage terminase large subunit-like protein
LVEWWIDQDTGYPIPERAGWLSDSPDLDPTTFKTLAFVPAKLSDNPALTTADPSYLSNLMAMPQVERERLLGGNWKIRPAAGKVFNRARFGIVQVVPAGGEECRFWDFAGTAKELAGDDPDYTAGVRMRRVDGMYYIMDCMMVRADPAAVLRLVKNTADQDREAAKLTGTRYMVAWEEEPGSAGRFNTQNLARLLEGHNCRRVRVSGMGDKVQRAQPLAAQAEAGNVKMHAGMQNMEVFLQQAHNMPDGEKDDAPDAASGAFQQLANVRRLNIT